MCFDCNASRICTGKYRLYSPTCAPCGARLVQQLRDLTCTRAEVKQRQEAVIAEWSKWHSKAEMLELIAGPLAYEPIAKRK